MTVHLPSKLRSKFYILRRGWVPSPRWALKLNKSLFPSFIWTSAGFLLEILILKGILLGLNHATMESTNRKWFERFNDQTHLPLCSAAE